MLDLFKLFWLPLLDPFLTPPILNSMVSRSFYRVIFTLYLSYWRIQKHCEKIAPLSIDQSRRVLQQSSISGGHGGRKASINRQVIIDAAIHLVGPHRSISTLSLREVARQAQIAPNSFYRHFKDTDELAIAVIEEAGCSLRKIIRDARLLISQEHSVVRSSVESFMKQLDHDQYYLPILLREGQVGSDGFQIAVNHQLDFFAQELELDIKKLSEKMLSPVRAPHLVAKAVTRLVFAMGSDALTMNSQQRQVLAEDLIVMVKMILRGARLA